MTEQLGLGGGCHWCTEAVFQSVPGVLNVEQGYIHSKSPENTWSEAVIIHFTELTDLDILIMVHLETHNSTSNHSRRKEYRSAIYYFEEEDKVELIRIMDSLSR